MSWDHVYLFLQTDNTCPFFLEKTLVFLDGSSIEHILVNVEFLPQRCSRVL